MPSDGSETVTEAVEAALGAEADGWRVALARTLAAALDVEPNASMARELRALMNEIDAVKEPEGSGVADDLRSRRAARIAAASGQ